MSFLLTRVGNKVAPPVSNQVGSPGVIVIYPINIYDGLGPVLSAEDTEILARCGGVHL